MSRRRELARRLAALTDIRGILAAMKSLALMETRILKDFFATEQRMVAGIEAVAADFLAWHRRRVPPPPHLQELLIAIGSEQGFCGDFNETIAQAAQGQPAASGWVVVGRRLWAKLEREPRVARSLQGATLADEVPAVLLRLADELERLQAAGDGAPRGLSALYHCELTGEIRLRRLLPLPDLPSPRDYTSPPDLHLSPGVFFRELTRHYLYAALNEVLYSSLMAENQRRLEHMDRALQRLDKDTGRLKLAYNAQRQEEIIEEIEVLLLSADALGEAV
jgi:F-type H+-transporting ATPase subunit gamma